MIISVRKLPYSGLHVQKNLAPEELELETSGLSFDGPIRIDARVTHAGDVILAETKIDCCVLAQCSRCLNNVQKSVNIDFTFDYPFDPKVDTINLGEDIRQEIIMNVPPQILCSEECLGLCTKCGVNLNDQECQCEKSQIDMNNKS